VPCCSYVGSTHQSSAAPHFSEATASVSFGRTAQLQDVLDRDYVRDRDLRISFGDGSIERVCWPHRTGAASSPALRNSCEPYRISAPGHGTTSRDSCASATKRRCILRARCSMSIPFSPCLPRTNFVLTLHRANGTADQVAYVGGRWDEGRATIAAMINAATTTHGIHAMEAPAHLRGTEPTNLTNRGKLGYGIQTGVLPGRQKPVVSAGLLGRRTGSPQSTPECSCTSNPHGLKRLAAE